jgi:hypothetical protein
MEEKDGVIKNKIILDYLITINEKIIPEFFYLLWEKRDQSIDKSMEN